MEELCDMVKLAQLLYPKRNNNSDSEEDSDTNTNAAGGPADIGKTAFNKNEIEDSAQKTKPQEVLHPEDDERLYFGDDSNVHSDWKKYPQWDVSYKQLVTPTDVFLGMTGKNSATASCEDMILTICLPGETHQNIDLKITKDNLKLTSPQFRLEIPLPQPVDPQRGNAKWDKDAEKLVITLRMDREFDYVNF